MKRCLISGLIVLAFAASSVAGVGGPASASNATRANHGSAYTDGRYIVTFADEPVASYEGSRRGFPATRPQPGRKLDPNSPAVQRWQQHLTAKHDAALAQVGASKLYDYTVVNNGVAADLTAEQATDLAATPGVIALQKDALAQPATTTTPEFLGLTAAGGLWSQLGGDEDAGAGIVVGVIDTGIWPESLSFTGGTAFRCRPTGAASVSHGEQFTKQTCNDKLIGARYYLAGLRQAVRRPRRLPVTP